MAFLIVEKGSKDVGAVFPLEESRALIIGRPTDKSKPDIAIDDDWVSRGHVEISHRQGCFMLRDVGSTNETEIDGQRIEKRKSYPLRPDSAIGLAIIEGRPRVVLRFKESDKTDPPTKTDEARVVTWLNIDEERKEALVEGKPVPLSRKEYGLVLFLYRKAGRVCSRDEIIPEVWPEAEEPGAVSDATVDQLIHRLREKIEPDPSNPSRITSKKGFGYKLV